jgi:hypothetical protein
MRERHWLRCRVFGGRRRLPSLLACGISGVLLLSVGSVALAAGGGVVAPGGKVAGKGYSYWLERTWQVAFAAPTPPGPKVCETLKVNGKRVAMLEGGYYPQGPALMFTCSEPSGRPMYVAEPSAECSTLRGDHNGFGTTRTELERCARAMFSGSAGATLVDGRPVANFQRFITATGLFPVHAATPNFLGATKGLNGQSAAHGYGLLLKGFAKGTHTVVVIGDNSKATFTLHVN